MTHHDEAAKRLREALEAAQAQLEKAADQFAFYADEHAKKGTLDGDAKGAVNHQWALACAKADHAVRNALPDLAALLDQRAGAVPDADEDWFEEVISDTLDMDWQPRWAARAILTALEKEGWAITAAPTPPAAIEVEDGAEAREAIARLCLSALFGFEFTGESLVDEAGRIFSEPNPRATRAVNLADRIIARLRTPAASSADAGLVEALVEIDSCVRDQGLSGTGAAWIARKALAAHRAQEPQS